ncbi:MAG: glycosyltransferase family 2 protein [Cyanobacteria bacterium P01_G01_bin.19]
MKQAYLLTVNYNSSELILRLINSLTTEDRSNYQLVIVNNSPEDRKISDLKHDFIHIIESKKNLGFGKACNLGLNWIAQQNHRVIAWLINPDAYFETENNRSAIKDAIALFQKHPHISILGTTVYNAAGEMTSAGGTFTPDTAALTVLDRLPANLEQDYFKTDWVSGCSLLINLANFKEVPQFCDRFFLYYEDLDFCLRYRQQGHQIAVTNLLKVIHDTSTITDRNILQKYRHITQSYLIYIEKYGSKKTFIITNLRMILNTIRLLILKPQQGMGKAIGIYEYWQSAINN